MSVFVRGRVLASFAAVVAIVLALVAVRQTPGGSVPVDENAYRANNLGVAYLEQFDYESARNSFQQALDIQPGFGLARLNLSIALFYLADLEGAAREAAEAERLMPASPHAAYMRALAAREQARDDDAIRAFTRVLELDPGDGGAMVNRALVYLQNGRLPEAIEGLRQAVDQEPYNVTAAYNLGLAMTRGGQPAEGEALIERSQRLREAGYAVTYSNAYFEQGQYAQALTTTGAEAGLVDAADPGVRFSPVPLPGVTIPAPPESPFGREYAASDLTSDRQRAIAQGLGGGVALIDYDNDGDHDLFVAAPGDERLLRNDAGTFIDATSQLGIESAGAGGIAVGAVAADYDNDGLEDLFVLRHGSSSLYRNAGGGRFADATAESGLPPSAFLPGASAFADVDHDGDVDLVVAGLADLEATARQSGDSVLTFPGEFAAAPLRLFRNNGNRTFTDVTSAAHLDVRAHAVGVAPTDFDNRRDIDLLIADATGESRLFRNMRDGTFADVARETGIATGRADIVSIATGDINKDDFPDFLLARAAAPGLLMVSDGRGRFNVSEAPAGAGRTVAGQLLDYDNDGLLDLVVASDGGLQVLRRLSDRWSGVTATTAGNVGGDPASARSWVAADIDRDGDTDLIARARSGELTLWRNDGPRTNRSMRVDLIAQVSNRSAVGAKVQMRAGSLVSRFETSAASPAVAPVDAVLGLGRRMGADAVRVLWPSGTVQAELAQSPPQSVDERPRAALLGDSVTIQELDRKPSSCPFLYVWNGHSFEFVTDFLGGGEMGYWEGPGHYNHPDPVEYVRIRGDQLKPDAGRYQIRVTNELEETVFFDRLQLHAIAHPIGADVFPDEGMTAVPKPHRLIAVANMRPPALATDGEGRDMTGELSRVDRRYADRFTLLPFRGYAETHALMLDLGPVEASPVLLLTGWTDYAFSSDNLAAHQAGLSLQFPSLEVKTTDGRWRTAVADIGIPVGRPQTVVVDLTGRLRPGERMVRITTNMRVYWDAIAVAGRISTPGLRTARFDADSAQLRERGFSSEVSDDAGPMTYDYANVLRATPWKVMRGAYTRPGEVTALLSAADDMFAITMPGDELVLSFPEDTTPLPSGWTRTFMLLADGFSKEMDLNSASPDEVEPLPFHAMTRYPYPMSERYPDAESHRRYRAEYNTRIVRNPLPRIEVGVAPLARAAR